MDIPNLQPHSICSGKGQQDKLQDSCVSDYATKQNECVEAMEVTENVAVESQNHAQLPPARDKDRKDTIDEFSYNAKPGTNDIKEENIINKNDETQADKSLTYSVDIENGASLNEQFEIEYSSHTEKNAGNMFDSGITADQTVDEALLSQPCYTSCSLSEQKAAGKIYQSTASTDEQVPFISLKKDQSILTADTITNTTETFKTDDRQEQIFTTIYGQCIGDAVGLLTEFLSKEQAAYYYKEFPSLEYDQKVNDSHRRRWLVGDWTDDSDQMLLILQSLLDKNGEVSQIDFAQRIVHWMQNGFPEFGDTGGLGIGHTTYITITDRHFQKNPCKVSKRVWERSNRTLAPNGGVMRTSILGIHDWWDLEQVVENAKAICKTTHFDPRCIVSAICVCVAISLMLQRSPEHFQDGKYNVDKIIEDVWKCATRHIDETGWGELSYYLQCTDLDALNLDECDSIGYTYKCLGAGFWALKQDNFRKAIEAIARSGGDADTNGAVAGALLACKLMRRDLIPDTWLHLKHKEWLDNKIYEYLQVLNRRRLRQSPNIQEEEPTAEINGLEEKEDESQYNQETKSEILQKDRQENELTDERLHGLDDPSKKAPTPQIDQSDIIPPASEKDETENMTPNQREQSEFQPPDIKKETSDDNPLTNQDEPFNGQPSMTLKEKSKDLIPNNQVEISEGRPQNNQGETSEDQWPYTQAEISEGKQQNNQVENSVDQTSNNQGETLEGQPLNNEGQTSEVQPPINQEGTLKRRPQNNQEISAGPPYNEEEPYEDQTPNNQTETSSCQPPSNQVETAECQLPNNQGETTEYRPPNNQGETPGDPSQNNYIETYEGLSSYSQRRQYVGQPPNDPEEIFEGQPKNNQAEAEASESQPPNDQVNTSGYQRAINKQEESEG